MNSYVIEIIHCTEVLMEKYFILIIEGVMHNSVKLPAVLPVKIQEEHHVFFFFFCNSHKHAEVIN